MKTMKFIVLCLSLFLVSNSAFAQISPSVKKLIDELKNVNTEIELIVKKPEGKRTPKESTDLETLKMLKMRLNAQIRNTQDLILELGEIKVTEIQKKVMQHTIDYWAREITWQEYINRIFDDEFTIKDRRYAYTLLNNQYITLNQEIACYKSEKDKIIENLPIQVQELTGGIYTPRINQDNLKHHPHDPYYFSKVVNDSVKAKSSPLSEQTLQNIQQTFNNAVNKSEEIQAQIDETKEEYEHNLDVLNNLCGKCPQCCKQK